MREVLVRSIYNVDTISKGNQKAWVKLMGFMESEAGEAEDVMFDFKGIEVIQPWATEEFKKFMQDERVHVKLWCNATTAESINIMCRLSGCSTGRAVNEEIQVERKATKEEIQVERMSNELQKYFEADEDDANHASLMIFNRFDQIGVPITVDYIEEAIKKYCKSTGKKFISLEARNIAIQPSVIKNVTALISKFNREGITLEINSYDEEIMTKIGMYQSLESSNVGDEQDKLRLIKSVLYPGKVGMLQKYKASKAVDEFGRRGKGQVLSCRVALYRGLERTKDGIHVKFTSYDGNYFYTKHHWGLEHDNEVLKELKSEELSIPLDQFGMYNDFLGSQYHLLAPVQMQEKDTITMYGVDDTGSVTYNKLTIPERIKAVFDDWGIEYDTESLQIYIQKTREILG